MRSKAETIRRLRKGDVLRLIRSRCGHTLPDDDAGREYLCELLLPISLGLEPAARMANAIEVLAPWMGDDETVPLIECVSNLPTHMRTPKAETLGQRLRVTNVERERLRLWTIAPCDMSPEDLAEFRKAKARARMKALRRKRGTRTRAVYLAKSLSRNKPWIAEGISRRTWERRRTKAAAETSPCAVLRAG